MATKCTIKKYLNGYPNLVGNKKQVRVVYRGPTDYDAPGVALDIPKHVINLHELRVTGAKNATTGRANIIVILPTNPPIKPADVQLIFLNAATGLVFADNTDLSAYEFTATFEGTN